MHLSRRTLIAGGVIGTAATALGARFALGQRSKPGPSVASFKVGKGERVLTSNGLPGHPTGDFPNRHDPVPLREQSIHLVMPVEGTAAEQPTPLNFWHFGVAVNGVPFDPSGPFWNRDASSGWEFEVLSPAAAVALGIDANRAHTQGRGMYHYHGLPTALYWSARLQSPESKMHLLGWAADGFPIYGPECPGDPADPESPLRRLRSSYRIRPGRRADGPGGRHDGTFVQDFVFEEGLGDLDACNGRKGPTPEFPGGTYHYVLTDEFPFIPRQYRGKPDPSFKHGPPPGVSPPVPSELLQYRADA